ncbi:MAG: hypothetical protein QF741_01005 [Candidatus Peribacteraceae bacterium]|jgi:hypothetical protein|nr:hypothetical protein [Candidatus Peribacteraceae bacterium]MDP7454258.1 hypothetical protein [Candidatus Peribacteraceae bacterium]|tara:strand:+ start:2717 stop:3037 length:321 start_codon:yes stop_codon:yes gene_type:complete
MVKYLHQLSAFLFFALGISFFAAYFLLKNEMMMTAAAWWMQRADLPFAFVTIMYGGLSLFRSLNPNEKPANALALAITIPLIIFFLFLVVLNFWEVLGLPKGETMI